MDPVIGNEFVGVLTAIVPIFSTRDTIRRVGYAFRQEGLIFEEIRSIGNHFDFQIAIGQLL